MPDVPGQIGLQCADCSAHFQLDPSGSVAGAACSECGGSRFFRSQPSPTQSDGTLRDMVDSDSQLDQGGNPLNEGTIVGDDGEKPRGYRDNYMHSKVGAVPDMLYEESDIPEGMSMHQYRQAPHPSTCPMCQEQVNEPSGYGHHMYMMHPEMASGLGLGNDTQTVAKRVEMQTLDMEPYAPLWDESYTKLAGPLAVLPVAEEGGALAGGAASGGLGSMLMKAIPTLMKGIFGGGQQAGSMAPQAPTPAPTMEMTGSSDIPWLLLADLETPHSVKSIDEQHDDPEKQDQKEFNDGDKSPSNMKNPNNQDTGADGEDGVRDATPGYGLGPNSPSVERAMMILPLLLHYFQSGESGQSDPLIRGLHDAFEQESPGYMDNEDPEGHKYVELIVQQHGKPQHHQMQSGVNAFTGDLAAFPAPGNGMQQPSGGGRCPSCGGVLTGNGYCPQCGNKSNDQWGAQADTPTGSGGGMGGVPSGGPSYPPNAVMSNTQGPTTPEQIQAMQDALEQRGMSELIPDMLQNPQNWGWLLNEIQNQPNTPPLVDPSQQQPTPAPMGGQMNPPGGMPVMDPSQPGGGGGMPMQPMAKKADANNVVPRCPKCNGATTSFLDGLDGDSERKGRCHGCDHVFTLKESRIVLTDLVNPVLMNAADKTDVHPEAGQDPSMTWVDSQGRPIEEGATYELSSPKYPVPDQVKVVSKKPDELGVKIVGEFSNITSDPNDVAPDFTIKPQDLHSQKYTFTPSAEAQGQPDPNQPLDGMPGVDQIPQSGQTTDEATNSYPNPGTVSHILAAEEVEPELYDDLCHKCGCDWVHHTASSSTRMMHECSRCGTVWETEDRFEGRQSNVDLSWLNEDSRGEDFFDSMERARSMASYGQKSRDLASIVSSDPRLQAVRDVLSHNKSERERTAGRHFTPGEQRELVNERGKARNSDLLDLEGTHYVTSYLPTSANGLNAPDEHLVLGL